MGKILVIGEYAEGKVRKGTLAAITFARQAAARTGGTYDLAVVGSGIGGIAQELAKYGAGKVYAVDGPVFAAYTAQAFAFAIAEVAQKAGSTVVVATASTFGKDCMPRVAARLKGAMASEVVKLGDNPEKLTYVRPMWAGNVLGEVEIATPVHVLTIRTTEFDAAPVAAAASPVEAVASSFDAGALRQKVVEFRPTRSARPDLQEARVVVAGGRGLKTRDNFKMIEDLADLLHGAVGATRAAVDAEMVANDYQIGQTGKIVAPELYIGAGLSGAIQHLAGMKNSKVIVAINKDEEAPIFSVADYGLVGDLFKAIPELTEKIKAKK